VAAMERFHKRHCDAGKGLVGVVRVIARPLKPRLSASASRSRRSMRDLSIPPECPTDKTESQYPDPGRHADHQ
jgi:hypothetical protein